MQLKCSIKPPPPPSPSPRRRPRRRRPRLRRLIELFFVRQRYVV